ncbi:hypothetical protein FCM35_KLT17357 [Carex littledalei]|uniref:Uncharacterized protein n=1 Tax=Carex littledalei TaxID=544730 RepID=A0A833VRC3_9POAL|nr:hypothetical protein FCM35_KLT17357 [Carex littledalei]
MASNTANLGKVAKEAFALLGDLKPRKFRTSQPGSAQKEEVVDFNRVANNCYGGCSYAIHPTRPKTVVERPTHATWSSAYLAK